MIIEYEGVTIDCSPAAIKIWVEGSDLEEFGCPGDGESCLVHQYLTDRLHAVGLAPIIYVGGAPIPGTEDTYTPSIDIGDQRFTTEAPLLKVISAFDTRVKGQATKTRVLTALTEAGAW